MGFYGLLLLGMAISAIVCAMAWAVNKQTNFHIPLVLPSICFGVFIIAAGLVVGAWDGMSISIIGLGTLAYTILPACSMIVNRFRRKKG